MTQRDLFVDWNRINWIIIYLLLNIRWGYLNYSSYSQDLTSNDHSQSSKQYSLTTRSSPTLVSLQNAMTFILLSTGKDCSSQCPTTANVAKWSVSKLTWLLLGKNSFIPLPFTLLTTTHSSFFNSFKMIFHLLEDSTMFAPWGIWSSRGPVNLFLVTR